MIRILHLITDLNTGGAEIMLSRLVLSMNRGRFDNKVVSLTNLGQLGGDIQASGVPVFSLQMRRGIPNPLGIWRLFRLVKKERPQVLQTWLYHADLLGLLVGKLVRVSAITWNVRCSEMDMAQYSALSSIVRSVLVKLSRLPEAVVSNSMAGRQFHEAFGYRPRKWTVIPNGIDVDRFSPNPEARTKLRLELGVSHDIILVGLIARFDPMKDHINFLQAAKCLLKTHPKTHFVLAGQEIDHQNTELTNSINALNIRENVHLLGERMDVQLILPGLDILASSSFSEGFPNVVGEAMACGLPCVVTDVGDSAWIVQDTGRVVSPRDPQALANGWRELIEMGSEHRQQLGLVARQRVKESFDLKKIAVQYENFYEELVMQK